MIVCICHRVSDRDIAHEAAHGCADFDALQSETRAGTSCGACVDFARAVFERHRSACHAVGAVTIHPMRRAAQLASA